MKVLKTLLKILAAVAALAGIAAAVYFAVQHFLGDKKSEYYDDDDFFECECNECSDLAEPITPMEVPAPAEEVEKKEEK